MIRGIKFIGVKVHDDGDIELSKHEDIPMLTDKLFYYDEEHLSKELIDYGATPEGIEEALVSLKTNFDVIV